MPRLSLYRPNRQNDYKFLDRTIAEMYTVGGLDIYVHKYLGPKPHGDDSSSQTGGTQDATQPAYSYENPLFVEDLLLIENRDRAYSQDVYIMRGVYNQQDIDFDLTQFGLFLNNDTLFITFHYNDMINTLGRKLMSGDVLEFPNLKDYNPLNEALPKALPKYYVIQDAAFASEGFSPVWLPHLWRVKATPLVGAQEYNDILSKPFAQDNIWDPGNYYPRGSIVLDGNTYYKAKDNTPVNTPITDTNHWEVYTPETIQESIGTRKKDYELNDAILAQAEFEVPKSGYDAVKFYIVPTNIDGTPADPASIPTVDYTVVTVDTTNINSDAAGVSPRGDGYTAGYLSGDGIAPNGLPVTPGISFPLNAQEGDYALRLDYFPNRLFRFSGKRWVKIEDAVRTNLTPGPENKTLRSSFVNNTATTQTADRGPIPQRQGLSNILKPEADN
jgi:hypothetical protein